MNIKQRIKDWYQGEYVPPPPNDPSSPLVFVSPGHYEQPLLAKLMRMASQFWLAHWQWIVGTALALVGIVVAL